MNTEELTLYIKNYVQNDNTRSAIMLTGEWGCGKSHYIQNVLTDELNKCNYDVATVSLYGVKTIAELNRSIYLELRAKKVFKKAINSKKYKEYKRRNKLFDWIKRHGKEVVHGTALIGKTIVKGVAGFFNVPVEFSDKDLEKLFSSINLNDKLIVLEDLERSSISILEVMGYVNNLVEQDGVKVLLVANESEIIKSENEKEQDQDDKGATNKVPTKTIDEYLRIKEKTISDTISFYANLDSSIRDILLSFKENYFVECLKEKMPNNIPVVVDEIEKVMLAEKCYNLRALLYACQKTIDMFKRVNYQFDIHYFIFVLCGNIAFALKLGQNNNLKWTDNVKSPEELGSYHFPLHRFAYDYIKNQYFDEKALRITENFYLKTRELHMKQGKASKSLEILYSFFFQTESDVSDAVKKIKNNLVEGNVIPFSEYGRIANCLIAVRGLIDNNDDIDDCKKSMLNNLSNSVIDDSIIYSFKYHSGVELWTDAQKKEYNEFSDQMVNCSRRKLDIAVEQISSNTDIDKLIDVIYKNSNKYIASYAFFSKIDVKGMLKVLPDCKSLQIAHLRGAVVSVYNSSNIGEFLSGDKDSLSELKDGIMAIIDGGIVTDKIKLLHFNWFARDIDKILTKL